jgi:hypothetical protein
VGFPIGEYYGFETVLIGRSWHFKSSQDHDAISFVLSSPRMERVPIANHGARNSQFFSSHESHPKHSVSIGGPEIPRGIGFCGENLHQENKFQVACNENMRLLRDVEQWPEYLDLQIAAISFQRGAQWAYRTYNRTRNVES